MINYNTLLYSDRFVWMGGTVGNAIDILKKAAKKRDFTIIKTDKFTITFSNFLEAVGIVVLIISLI